MFDIGVNLTSSQFAKDRDDVVARAFDAGVNGLLITGTNLRESQQAQKLARQYSSCWSTAGVHPRRDAGVRGAWNLYRHYRLGLR